MSDEEIMKSAGLWEKDFSSGIQGYNLAGVLLFGKDEVIRSCCSDILRMQYIEWKILIDMMTDCNNNKSYRII